jgi:predicted dehydrogenase
MLKIALVGIGNWATHMHGPALAHYANEHPGEVELAAVCVRTSVERAQEFCHRFGFQRVYTDLDTMIDTERPDACWSITPIGATRQVAGHVMQRGIPVLFEKPPGANLCEAQELADISRRTGTPNMVAFNRRWAACTRKALEWASAHGPIEHISARMLRAARLDEEFAYGTGIHLLDCVRALAEPNVGRMRSARTSRFRSAAGVWNFHVDISFSSGAAARCEILPACGMLDESYTLFGARHTIRYILPWTGGTVDQDGEAQLWVEGELKESERWSADPLHLSSGIYGEAVEFISALREGRRPSPSAEEAVDSVALAEAVQEGRDITFA